MCCLFGVLDHHGTLTRRQRQRLVTALSVAAQVRGTDATGLAYISGGRLRICKEPRPARAVHFHLPGDAAVVMGHTRMTTQGSAKRNYNNHPFLGVAGSDVFALAHNGVLHNDQSLRSGLHLPRTKIETDSYIAVQLIEQKKALNFDSLKYMAEQVEGSFTFTVLDRRDRLYIVKGDNPLCLYHIPSLEIYLYASTEEILRRAVTRMGLGECRTSRVSVGCGEILRLDRDGTMIRSEFDDYRLFSCWQAPLWGISPQSHWEGLGASPGSGDYLEEVKSVAAAFGYAPEEIDRLAKLGFSPEELEEFLYCGEL